MNPLNLKWLQGLSCRNKDTNRHKFAASCRLNRKSYEPKPIEETYSPQIEEKYQQSIGLFNLYKKPEPLHTEDSYANHDSIKNSTKTMISTPSETESTYYSPSDRKDGPIKNIDEKIYRVEDEASNYQLGYLTKKEAKQVDDLDSTLRKEPIQFADAISSSDSLPDGCDASSPSAMFSRFPPIPSRPSAEYLEMKAGGDCLEVSRSRSPSSRRPSGGNMVLAKSCLSVRPQPDEDLLKTLDTTSVAAAPRAEQEDCISTLEGAGLVPETYEEAWDLKLQRKLNMPAGGQPVLHTYVNGGGRVSSPPPSSLVGIRRNPEISAFRLAKPPPTSLSLQANLAVDSTSTTTTPPAPPVPRHQSSNNHAEPLGNVVFLDKPLIENPWYHVGLNRRVAESLLMGQPDGTFLIRPSETKTNEYALSIAHEGTVTHMLIAQNEQGKFVLGRFSSAYDSIQAMINNFLSRDLRVQNSTTIRLKYAYTTANGASQ